MSGARRIHRPPRLGGRVPASARHEGARRTTERSRYPTSDGDMIAAEWRPCAERSATIWSSQISCVILVKSNVVE